MNIDEGNVSKVRRSNIEGRRCCVGKYKLQARALMQPKMIDEFVGK